MSERAQRAPRRRRTQEERRAATIAKLLDATIESVLKVGYSRTTVKEICARSKLSHGALFRFFPTLLDLVLAAAEEIARRQIAEFEARFQAVRDQPDSTQAAVLLLRDACRSPINAVFYELLVAARTDVELRRALKPGIRRYFASIRETARRLPLPGLEALPEEALDTLLFTVLHLFDGESLVRRVYSEPALEERRIAMLGRLLSFLLSVPSAI